MAVSGASFILCALNLSKVRAGSCVPSSRLGYFSTTEAPGANLWHCRMHKISTSRFPYYKLAITRKLRFLHRGACMDPSQFTFQTLSSRVVRLKGLKMMKGLKPNNLVPQPQIRLVSGKLEEWIPSIRSLCWAAIVEERLLLPPTGRSFSVIYVP